MNNGRDCAHERQVGKCDTCDFIDAEQRILELEAQVEILKEAINTALRGTVFDEVGNRDVDGLIPFCEVQMPVRILTAALCELSKIQAAKAGE